MLDTGFPRADVDNDFLRARRRQFLAALAHRLRGQDGDSDRLVPLDEVTDALGCRGERQLGLHTIPLDTIIGTAGSRHDFDRRFRPTNNRVRPRWEQLALAQRRGVAIPPIEVYRVGDLHFVSDGHHRVSIAAATAEGPPSASSDFQATRRPGGVHVEGAPRSGLNKGFTTLIVPVQEHFPLLAR